MKRGAKNKAKNKASIYIHKEEKTKEKENGGVYLK